MNRQVTEENERTYDFVILGNGAAAFAAAIKADELGKRTAMVQGGTIGGTCVNVGCVPSKRLLVAGEIIRNTVEYDLGRGTLPSHREKFNFSRIVQEKNKMVSTLRSEKYENVLDGLSNVTLYKGMAEFVSENEIRIHDGMAKDKVNSEGKIIRGQNFLIATGSSTRIPNFSGTDKIDYWTNIEALDQKKAPRSLIVIGGRALGLEFAQMYNRLGVRVTLLQRSETIIPDDEPELVEALTEYLKEDGINIQTNVQVKRISSINVGRQGKSSGKKLVAIETETSGKHAVYKAEALLLATGRGPNSKDIGLERLGIETKDGGAVKIDDEMNTNVPNVYAAGDVTGEPMLEALAAREGTLAAENALTGSHRKIDLNVVPRAIFTDPQLASVGLTDAEAVKAGHECNCKVLNFSEVSKARIIGNTRGVIKMVAANGTHEILGIHILAPHAAELIHEAVMILKAKYKVEDVVDIIHMFPTLSESIKVVAQSYFRDVGATSCCI